MLAVVTMFGLLDLRFDPNPRFLNREFIKSMSFFEASDSEVSLAYVGWIYLSFFVLWIFSPGWELNSGGALRKQLLAR